MSDNYFVEVDPDTDEHGKEQRVTVYVVADSVHRKMHINILRNGRQTVSVWLSNEGQGRALLVDLAQAIDGIGWLPEGKHRFQALRAIVEAVQDKTSEFSWMGGSDTGVTDQEQNLIRSRIKHETKNFGLPPEKAAEIEILGFVPILWPGWEGHGGVALLRLPDGRLRFFVLDDVERGNQTVVEILRERLSAYAEASERTRAMLALIESQVDEDGKPLPIWDAVKDSTDKDPR